MQKTMSVVGKHVSPTNLDCQYCKNGQPDRAIGFSELRMGIDTGCNICSMLIYGAELLRASLFNDDPQLFDDLTGIVISGHRLRRHKPSTIPAEDCATLPLDIYSESKADCELCLLVTSTLFFS